jgi:hypothetical protein
LIVRDFVLSVRLEESSMNMLNPKFLRAIGALTILVGAPFGAQAADLLSGDVTAGNYSPNLSTLVGSLVTGPTTSPIVVQGFSFAFTADTITYTDPYNGKYADPGPGGFNGFVLKFSGIPAITGVWLDPNSQRMNPPTDLIFNSDTIFVAFDGGNQVAGQQSLIDVSFDNSAVPEPAPWAMMIAGFGISGGALRRQRTLARSTDKSAAKSAIAD